MPSRYRLSEAAAEGLTCQGTENLFVMTYKEMLSLSPVNQKGLIKLTLKHGVGVTLFNLPAFCQVFPPSILHYSDDPIRPSTTSIFPLSSTTGSIVLRLETLVSYPLLQFFDRQRCETKVARRRLFPFLPVSFSLRPIRHTYRIL